ncbi:MAG: hypothetical protein L0220_25015 [Acidobacteria bacterium]|nr:hypothetical protein [Acidobacteriota bacterium]
MDDERLLERASSGDETAFALLYQRHHQMVFRFTFRLLQSREIAVIAGIDIGTVKSRLYRARQRLRILLAPYFSKDVEIDIERCRI